MYFNLLFATPWHSIFDDGDPSSDDLGAGDPGSNDPPSGADDSSTEDKGKKLFTQEEVNKIMAENKRTLQKRNQELISQLENVRKAGNLSAEDRKNLNSRIEALENEMLTKEELAKKEQDKLVRTHQKTVEELTTNLDEWKSRYTKSTITRSITDAAASNSAFHPSQIVAILAPDTRLVEEVDAEGQPTGELIPKVKFRTTDKAGKTVNLELTVGEAVKQMKDMDEFFNLFKGEGTVGLGAGNTGGGKKADLRTLASDPRSYREARKAGKI